MSAHMGQATAATERRKAAIIGGGVIGGGWAARFLLNGWDVALFDPDPQAGRKMGEVLANARRSLPALYDRALPPEGHLSLHSDLGAAVAGADWVQESVPERLELKHRVYADLGQHLGADAVLASSTSGFKPSELTVHGARAIVAHPFNPVYLLPLVELVGDAALCARAANLLRGIGMYPLTLRREIDAHIADRLLEAVWRESLWLVRDGVATTAEIDEAIRMGFGLRWAQMGLFETYRIAGGEAGMRHFMAQFGPALEWPWTRLTDVPELTDELVDLIAGQSDAQSGHLGIRDLERLRDDNLVAMMRALKRCRSGAGGVLSAHEASLTAPAPAADDGLPVTLSMQVPSSWADDNGHVNDTHYLEAASKATDRFLATMGVDAGYIAGGKSFFTVESHICYHAETLVGDRMTVRTRMMPSAGKRLHLFHQLARNAGEAVATVEMLLLHVDLGTRKSCAPEAGIAARLAEYAQAQIDRPVPQEIGRHVGQQG